jgi:hypothetical protein
VPFARKEGAAPRPTTESIRLMQLVDPPSEALRLPNPVLSSGRLEETLRSRPRCGQRGVREPVSVLIHVSKR